MKDLLLKVSNLLSTGIVKKPNDRIGLENGNLFGTPLLINHQSFSEIEHFVINGAC
jgi:hypothetical protein